MKIEHFECHYKYKESHNLIKLLHNSLHLSGQNPEISVLG